MVIKYRCILLVKPEAFTFHWNYSPIKIESISLKCHVIALAFAIIHCPQGLIDNQRRRNWDRGHCFLHFIRIIAYFNIFLNALCRRRYQNSHFPFVFISKALEVML